MSRTEIREAAQDEMIGVLLTSIEYSQSSQEVREEMVKQFRRVEKLFGYDKDSWEVRVEF